MYTYDAIGSYERVGYGCQGSGKELMQPVLDSQLKAASPLLLPPQVLGGWVLGTLQGIVVMLGELARSGETCRRALCALEGLFLRN